MALLFVPAPVQAQAPADDARPLSPAQLALFETPHLQNVRQAGTLRYALVREGPAGFTDTVAMHIRRVNPDGTKNVAFDYLTGDRQVRFPELDNFRGNPVLMLTLERDAAEMKDQLGLSTSYFRNKIRESFVGGAAVRDVTYTVGGAAVPAREIVVHPFRGNDRLNRIPSLQEKTYTFILADAVPGTVAEIRIEVPADAAMAAPAFSQRTTFDGVTP